MGWFFSAHQPFPYKSWPEYRPNAVPSVPIYPAWFSSVYAWSGSMFRSPGACSIIKSKYSEVSAPQSKNHLVFRLRIVAVWLILLPCSLSVPYTVYSPTNGLVSSMSSHLTGASLHVSLPVFASTVPGKASSSSASEANCSGISEVIQTSPLLSSSSSVQLL